MVVNGVTGADDGAPPPARRADVGEVMQREYLRSVFKAESYYSVPVPTRSDEVGGDDASQTEDVIIQCISILQGTQRPKVIKTMASDDQDVERDAALALNIQYLQVRKREPNSITVFFDSEPEYISATKMAPWMSLRSRLTEWSGTVSDVSGCVDLTAPRLAQPTLALTDEKVPVTMSFYRLVLKTQDSFTF